jgi:hypothetical protein
MIRSGSIDTACVVACMFEVSNYLCLGDRGSLASLDCEPERV